MGLRINIWIKAENSYIVQWDSYAYYKKINNDVKCNFDDRVTITVSSILMHYCLMTVMFYKMGSSKTNRGWDLLESKSDLENT